MEQSSQTKKSYSLGEHLKYGSILLVGLVLCCFFPFLLFFAPALLGKKTSSVGQYGRYDGGDG